MSKPKQTVRDIKLKARHKTLVDVHKQISEWEVFNRDKVLKFLTDMARKAEIALTEAK